MPTYSNNSPTARALLMLSQETRRAREAFERVDLIVNALAQQWGAVDDEPVYVPLPDIA